MSKPTPYRHIPKDAGGQAPPVTLKPQPQAAASKQARTIIPPGVKVQVCPSPAYAKAPADAPVWRRPGAPAVYTGRISE